MTEPKFVNLDSHPITVRDPQGHQRTVRPFRELAAFHWRTEEDCVCVGAHYAKFPGLLSPFPEPEQQAAQPAQAVVGGAGLAAAAQTGRYKATGDVLRPDGSIKKDAQDRDDAAGAQRDAEPDEAVDGEDGNESEDPASSDEEDEQQDRPLEDVPGVSKVLAAALRKAGYASAVALANVQDEKSLAKLGKVKGVRDPGTLVDAAQTLLGWEEVTEDD